MFYGWYMGCEVTGILTQRSTEETFCVRITVTSRAQQQIRDIHIAVSVQFVQDTF